MGIPTNHKGMMLNKWNDHRAEQVKSRAWALYIWWLMANTPRQRPQLRCCGPRVIQSGQVSNSNIWIDMVAYCSLHSFFFKTDLQFFSSF